MYFIYTALIIVMHNTIICCVYTTAIVVLETSIIFIYITIVYVYKHSSHGLVHITYILYYYTTHIAPDLTNMHCYRLFRQKRVDIQIYIYIYHTLFIMYILCTGGNVSGGPLKVYVILL